VTPPLLALANPAQYDYLRNLLPAKAVHPRVVRLDGTGHYLVEERPEAVLAHLTEHLTQPS
jgi:pimeloyl-ACP methyl ester carboxylesterase